MKNMKHLYLLIALSIVTACQMNIEHNRINHINGSSTTSEALDQAIASLTDTANVTGLTVAVFNPDSIAYHRAFGYANNSTQEMLSTDHVFYGASFSKAVFGYLVAQLSTEGHIDLDVPLQSYLDVEIPDMYFEKEWRSYKNLATDLRYKQITARMCMSHTTGFPNWRWLTRTGQFDREGQIQIYTDPGNQYSYSGEGIMLLQYAIEKIMGQGLEELARERIFNPLQMDMTSYVWSPRFEDNYCLGHTSDGTIIEKDREDEAGAAGSMETTPTDYAKFLQKMLDLSAQSSPITDLMYSPNIRITSKKQFGPMAMETSNDNDDIALSYGLGWGIITTPHGYGYFKEGHSEGFQHYSIIFPEKQIGVQLMSNSDNAESIFKKLLEISIGDIYTPWYWENYVPFDHQE